MVIAIILVIILTILKGVVEAIKDKISFHYYESIFYTYNDSFWDPEISWRRKYKNGIPEDGPRFFLSTTTLVFLTDGWHLMKWLNNRFSDLIALLIFTFILNYNIIFVIICIIIYNVIKNVIFEVFFDDLLNSRK